MRGQPEGRKHVDDGQCSFPRGRRGYPERGEAGIACNGGAVRSVVEGPEVATLLGELTTMVGRADPYPRYARLRELSPVVRAEDGALVLTRYADCFQLTRDPRLAHLPPDVLAFLGYPDWPEHPALRQLFTSMLVLNPPDHTRLRRLVSGAFTARRVQALRPAIRRLVDGPLDPMAGPGGLLGPVRLSVPGLRHLRARPGH